MTISHTHPPYWDAACQHLSAADPVMARMIDTYEGESLQGKGDGFFTLARAIVGQQVSVRSADAIWYRLEAKLPKGVTAEAILQLTEDDFRDCGFSRQKIAYVRNIAEHFTQHGVGPGFFDPMDDLAVTEFLVAIKGVGRWTAEMFLIFHLMRPDVWPVDDIGLQKAILKEYTLSEFATKKEMLAEMQNFGERFRPWRSVALWYLWRSIDPVPVAY
ncbi:MAG: DNA-3-methyladenine glycosylase [Rickettsiales bacterium]|mgnify:CR=1 FL=1|nr:DNA-3-methyladenine glycosylase [Rickettsiales bacterium]